MLTHRKHDERGHSLLDWLDSYHTFSFSHYWDPQHVGFSDLLVINDDTVQPARGFGKHPHRDMEILSYVLDGALEHQDSEGNHGVIRANDIQLMRAGRGIAHSEFNHSPTDPVHFLQIWIVPGQKNLQPGYQQTHIEPGSKRGAFRLILSPDGKDGSLQIAQDARVFARVFDAHESATLNLPANRYAYVFVARGSLTLNGIALSAGDSVKAVEETALVFTDAAQDSEVLIFDLRPKELPEM